jgi:hypothetical protein
MELGGDLGGEFSYFSGWAAINVPMFLEEVFPSSILSMAVILNNFTVFQ